MSNLWLFLCYIRVVYSVPMFWENRVELVQHEISHEVETFIREHSHIKVCESRASYVDSFCATKCASWWVSVLGENFVYEEIQRVFSRVCEDFSVWIPHLPLHKGLDLPIGSLFVLGGEEFRILEDVGGKRDASGIYRAEFRGEEVVLKCKFANAPIFTEYNRMVYLRDEYWCPKIKFPPSFSADGRLRCFAMELVNGRDLRYMTRDSNGLINWSVLSALGLRMLGIFRTLHLKYGIAHEDAHIENWMTVGDADLYLVDFETSKIVTSEGVLDDLNELVVLLRYLRDKDFVSGAIDRVCPNRVKCPGGLREAIIFVRSLHQVTDETYNIIEDYLRIT
jgi:predicted Ser/Thr protein kinase